MVAAPPPAALTSLRATQDDDNTKEALRYSAALLGELRTSLLRWAGYALEAALPLWCPGSAVRVPLSLHTWRPEAGCAPRAAHKSTTSCTCKPATSCATWRQAAVAAEPCRRRSRAWPAGLVPRLAPAQQCDAQPAHPAAAALLPRRDGQGAQPGRAVRPGAARRQHRTAAVPAVHWCGRTSSGPAEHALLLAGLQQAARGFGRAGGSMEVMALLSAPRPW